MGRLGRWFRVLWRGASALSTLQWLWGLLPAGLAGMIFGWIARAGQLPPVVIGVCAFAAFALAYIVYVAWRIDRVQRMPSHVPDRAVVASATHQIRRSPSDAGRRQSPADQVISRAEGALQRALDRVQPGHPAFAPEPLPSRSSQPRIRDRNTVIADALEYALDGRWSQGADMNTMIIRGRGVFNEPAERFRQAALGGELRVWGRRTPNGLFELIDPTFWEANELDLQTIIMPFQESASRPIDEDSDSGDQMFGIMVNRSEVEKVWNHEG